MFVYPLVHDLLAETKEEKSRAVRLINNTMNSIVDNGFLLMGVNKEHTRWYSLHSLSVFSAFLSLARCFLKGCLGS